MSEKNRLDQLALHFVHGIGSVMIRQLISHFGNATAVWKANKRHLMAVRGFGPMTFRLLKQSDQCHLRAAECMKRVKRDNISLLFHTDLAFPERLKHIPDAPSLLFYKGTADLNHSRMIAVVGTRSASTYGQQFTTKLIHELGKYKAHIISGLAYGIDINAHREALNTNIPTIAVMAGGLDRIYPNEHRKDVYAMLSNGGILSEHPPGTAPEAHNFPARNRIIAGMSDAVVVIEAAEKGGAQITARLANDYNREVFALPGPYYSRVSEGCHKLIKSHQANLLTSAEDIAYLLNWQRPKKQMNLNHDFTTEEKRIVSVLHDHPEGLHIDHLCWTANLTVYQAAISLVNLECRGIIKGLSGNRYLLNP